MIYYNIYKSPLGNLYLLANGDKLIGLYFENQIEALNKKLKLEKRDLEIFSISKNWLTIYFSGKDPDFLPPIKLIGSDFSEKIWQELLKIPYGSSKTYGQISQEIFANKKYSQTLGGAVGRNPISIIVPCHRVIGSDGRLTGYAGGLERKKFLLDLEGINYRK